MSIDALATGNNWYEPYVSGLDNLFEHIIEDYEMHPQDYEDWEKEILDNDSNNKTPEQEKRLVDYMRGWFSSRMDEHTY